jgi:hypothetical protein
MYSSEPADPRPKESDATGRAPVVRSSHVLQVEMLNNPLPHRARCLADRPTVWRPEPGPNSSHLVPFYETVEYGRSNLRITAVSHVIHIRHAALS